MEKKLKKFLNEYRNALILACLLCVPLCICLYLFVPKRVNDVATSPLTQVDSESLILEALDGNGSIECTFEGETSGNAYVKEGSVKITTAGQNIIYSHDKVYIWETASVSGKLIDIAKIPLAKSFINQDEISKQISKYQPTCVPHEVQESIFNPPAKLKFENYVPSMGDIMGR